MICQGSGDWVNKGLLFHGSSLRIGLALLGDRLLASERRNEKLLFMVASTFDLLTQGARYIRRSGCVEGVLT